jgi:hypothetical protein
MTARQQIRVGRLGRERSPIDAQPAPSLGEVLQAARERKGVDLFRAERDTKIRARHLAALESGDYEELPHAVYTKGFLRNYALYLGLDPEEILARWRDEQDYARRGEPTASVAPPPQPIAEPRRGPTFSRGIIVAAVLTVVVVAFAGYIGLQLIRFSQVPLVTIEGPARISLAMDATTFIVRGTAGPDAIITIKGPSGEVVGETTADENGAWATQLGVSKGRNEFEVIARDPATGRESAPAPLSALVPIPATPTPVPLPTPTPVPATPEPTLAPGATPTPVPPATPTSVAPVVTLPPDGSKIAATIGLATPAEGASVADRLVTVSGTSDTPSVTVRADWQGPANQDSPGDGGGSGPKAPDPVTVRVRDGSFETQFALPNGRWALTVSTVGSPTLGPASVSRTVDVKHTGLFLVVEAREGTAWLRVLVDGEEAEVGRTFRKGELQAFSGRRTVSIYTGNAGATFVTINGEPWDYLGELGQIESWLFEKGKPPRQE